jgi:hypothetical protein
MAHFAEIDSNNKVRRILVACNQDIANNGGELSEQAAKHFETIAPLSSNGVKWVQTSYNHNFRKQYAGEGDVYDSVKDIFIKIQPYPSWILDSNNDWKCPIPHPSIITYGNNMPYSIDWDEPNQRWIGKDRELNEFIWIPSSLSWIAKGN